MPVFTGRHTAPNNDTTKKGKKAGQEVGTNRYPSYFNFFFIKSLETSQLEIKTTLNRLPPPLSLYNL